jgi:glycosyltransferase involved in cell wall biosynthesis
MMTAGQDNRLVILIPAYNEELTISMVVMLAKKYAERVIVVDDGSKDRTSELAGLAGAEVIRQINTGKAGAIKTGIKRCLELSPECVVMIDGDGQMDPARIPEIAAPVLDGRADMVIGSRFIGETADIPRYRVFGQKMLNRATNLGNSVKITDSQSGYRALSRTALENLDFSSDSYNIESDMNVHFADRGLKIIEVPVSVRYDVPNGHKQKPMKHGLSVMARIISYLGYRHPLMVFGIPGIISFILGLVLCGAAFSEQIIIFNWALASQGMAGIATFGIGLFLMFAALILNSLGLVMQNLQMAAKINRK